MSHPARVLLLITIILGLVVGCSDQRTEIYDKAKRHYNSHQLDSALPYLEQLATDHPDNLNNDAWLAETHRRLGHTDSAITIAEHVLEQDSCHAFALSVLATATLPAPWDVRQDSDPAWRLVNRALACDSTDGSAWILLWGEAIMREQFDRVAVAERKLIETGFLTQAPQTYARWLMQALPDSAILVTSGDIDTYPGLGLQQTEGFRTDVLIVESGLLNLAPYLRHLNSTYGLDLPYPEVVLDSICANRGAYDMSPQLSEQVFRHWAKQKETGELGRPLAVAITVAPDYYAAASNQLQPCGPFLLWQPEITSDLDTASCRMSFADLEPTDFAGPWASEQDHSSVHHAYNYRQAGNVSETALSYAEALISAGRHEDAAAMLDWVEGFETSTELGSVFAEHIARLRSDLGNQ